MRGIVVTCLLIALAPVPGHTQSSICDPNPCADQSPEVQRQRRDFERRLDRQPSELLERPAQPNSVQPWSFGATVITGAQMRALGVITVADMIRQLQELQNAGGRTMRPPGPSFETRHFVLRGALDRLGEPLAELGPVFDEIYEYVSARTGLSVDRRIDVMLSPPEAANSVGGCPQRGMATPRYAATENLAAFGAIDDITILAAPDLPRVQLLGVLAHELGHVLMFEWLRDDFGASSTAIGEGFATWAAGRYMTDWYGIESLQAGVAELVRTGRYTPIAEQPGPYYTVPPDPDAAAPGEAVCLARRDRLYTEWGGFVGYLAEQGGTDVLLDLLRSAPGPDPFASVWGALDYSGIYGRELEALEADWLESL